jgi:carboxylesterase type B
MEDTLNNVLHLHYSHEEVSDVSISSNISIFFVDSFIPKEFNTTVGCHILGPTHADELGYEFSAFMSTELDVKSEDVKMLRRLVKMWTNFAKYG